MKPNEDPNIAFKWPYPPRDEIHPRISNIRENVTYPKCFWKSRAERSYSSPGKIQESLLGKKCDPSLDWKDADHPFYNQLVEGKRWMSGKQN